MLFEYLYNSTGIDFLAGLVDSIHGFVKIVDIVSKIKIEICK